MILPAGVAPEARLLLIGRALRAFCDGYVAVLLPAYLLALGFGIWEVGILSTATLLGSALATLAVGAWGHRFHHRSLLLGAALLMAATGLAFAGLSSFWPLLLIAFVGTMNPSSGDVSVFLPLEHARLADAAHGDTRTTLFARYSLTGALFAAVGALAAAVPDALVPLGIERLARCAACSSSMARRGCWSGVFTAACRNPRSTKDRCRRCRSAFRALPCSSWRRCFPSMPSPAAWW